MFLFFVGEEFIDVLGVLVRRLGALSTFVSLLPPMPFFCFDAEPSATLFFGDDFIVDALLVSFLGDDFDVSDGFVAEDFGLGLWPCFLLGVCWFVVPFALLEEGDLAVVLEYKNAHCINFSLKKIEKIFYYIHMVSLKKNYLFALTN